MLRFLWNHRCLLVYCCLFYFGVCLVFVACVILSVLFVLLFVYVVCAIFFVCVVCVFCDICAICFGVDTINVLCTICIVCDLCFNCVVLYICHLCCLSYLLTGLSQKGWDFKDERKLLKNNKVDTVRFYASYRLNLLLLTGMICVIYLINWIVLNSEFITSFFYIISRTKLLKLNFQFLKKRTCSIINN